MTAAVMASQEFLRNRVASGGCALDATAGQGHDTAFLARWLGPAGEVHACDIQPAALAATRRRWEQILEPKAGLYLHPCGHQWVRGSLFESGVTQLHAIMFNLGYLPGGDHEVITQPSTTLAALQSLLPMLAPGGALTIVAYPRHPGGQQELERLLHWALHLPVGQFRSHHLRPLNQGPRGPHLIAVEAIDWARQS